MVAYIQNLEKEDKEFLLEDLRNWQVTHQITESAMGRFFIDPFGVRRRRWQDLLKHAMFKLDAARIQYLLGPNMSRHASNLAKFRYMLELDLEWPFTSLIKRKRLSLSEAKKELQLTFSAIQYTINNTYGDSKLDSLTQEVMFISRFAYFKKKAEALTDSLNEGEKQEFTELHNQLSERLELIRKNHQDNQRYRTVEPIASKPPAKELSKQNDSAKGLGVFMVAFISLVIVPLQAINRYFSTPKQIDNKEKESSPNKLTDFERQRKQEHEIYLEKIDFERRFQSSSRRLQDILGGWINDYHRFHGSKALGFFPDAENQIRNLDSYIKNINEKSQRLIAKVNSNPAKISKLQLFADKISEDVRKYEMADERVQAVKQMPAAYDPEISIDQSIAANFHPHLRRI